MSNPFSLVNTPFAVEWITTHRTQSQRNATFGDPAKFPGDGYEPVVNAHNAVVSGLEKIEGLVRDPTRTDVSKHAVAKQVAEKAVATIQASATSLTGLAKSYNRRAKEMVDDRFAVDPDRASIQAEIRGWVRETAKAENGLATIRAAMRETEEVAAVIYHSPNFLLNLAGEVRANLAADGIEMYAPQAFKLISEADTYTALATKYTNAAKVVETTFYNSVLAEQAKLRVEAD